MKKYFLFFLSVLTLIVFPSFLASAQETASGTLTQSGASDSSGQTQSWSVSSSWQTQTGSVQDERLSKFVKKLEAYVQNHFTNDQDRLAFLEKLLRQINEAVQSNRFGEEKNKILLDLRAILSEKISQARSVYVPATPEYGPPSVICTELHRQGYMSDEWYEADSEYGRTRIDEATMAGYHSWAVPLTEVMRDSAVVTQMVRPFGLAWAQHMAHEMGVSEEDNALWATMQAIGVPINRFLGSVDQILNEGE